jgi:hypothetical protein
MDNQAASRVKDLLAKNDKIAIVVGQNPSLDQMAGALSLSLALQRTGKTVAVASPSEPIVANSSLVGIDKVKTVLAGDGGDLIVSFPYKEGEIEKVSYTLENGYLNIVVKAAEEGLSFEQQDVIFKRSGGMPSLLFVVGTARLSDLGALFDAEALKNTTVINIDNKSDNQGFGDVVLVSQQASSVSELVANLLTSLQLDIDQDMAQNLMSGLADATNNFQNSNTSFLAFEMAAVAMKKGARRLIQPVVKTPESSKSPFGPFTMPQPKPQQQSRVHQQPMHKPNRDVQKPWEPKPQQQPQQSRSQSPFTQPAPVAQQQMQQPNMQQPRPIQQVEHKEVKEEPETPSDWLSPKVYKSSTLI